MQAVMETYKRLGIAPTGGEGSWLFDSEGNRYLDFIGGIATNSLGHGHPALVGAIQEQAGKLIHCSNLYEIPLQAEVAEMLCGATDFDRVFFCNSGAESVEAAIKLARKYARARSQQARDPDVLEASTAAPRRSHGPAQPALQDGFGPKCQAWTMLPSEISKPQRSWSDHRPRPCSSSRSRARAALTIHQRVSSEVCVGFATSTARCSSSTRSRPALDARDICTLTRGRTSSPTCSPAQRVLVAVSRRGDDGQGGVRRAGAGQPRLHLRGQPPGDGCREGRAGRGE